MDILPIKDEQGGLESLNITISKDEAIRCGFININGELERLEVSEHPNAKGILIRAVLPSFWDKLADTLQVLVQERELEEMAKGCLLAGLSTDVTSQVTKLDLETIKKIQEEINNGKA